MATILKPSYGAAVALTTTVSGLTTDSNLLKGRFTTVVDNSSALAVDALVGGTLLPIATVTANTVIEIWVAASWDGGTTYLGNQSPTDAEYTFTTVGMKRGMKLGAVIDVTSATAYTYTFMFSVAQACGGTMPSHWALFFTHNCSNTGLTQGALKYTPVQYTNV
jgi:hypothetical protein